MPSDVKWRPTGARADWHGWLLDVERERFSATPYRYCWSAAALRGYESGRARTFAAACRAAERAARKMENKR